MIAGAFAAAARCASSHIAMTSLTLGFAIAFTSSSLASTGTISSSDLLNLRYVMPDAGPPPASLSFSTIVDKLRRSAPAKYSYALSRLGRQPMLYSQDPEQFHQFHGDDYGVTVPPDLSQRARLMADPTAGPLADPVRALLGETGEPVSVIAPYQAPVPGPGGQPGTEPGVSAHESLHQFMGKDKLDPNALWSQVDPQIHAKVMDALTKRNYPTGQFGDEIPARLFSGQYASLGLNQDEGNKLRQLYLDAYQKQSAAKANRIRLYTKNRTPVSWLDEHGKPVDDPHRDPETGVRIK